MGKFGGYIIFNTLTYAKRLEESGVSRQQAETHVQIIAEVIENDMATKQDLKELERNLKIEIQKLDDKVEKLEYRLIIKLGTLTTLIVATVTTLLKLLLK